MKLFPCCKINIGLNIVAKRNDGYHDLETIFFPIPLCDTLEVLEVDKESRSQCILSQNGQALNCSPNDNLIVKAYYLMAKDYDLPSLKLNLIKQIPSQAGLGGGSSDAAEMLKLINKVAQLNIENAKLEQYAKQLGADCAFFIDAKPKFAKGIGNIFENVEGLSEILKGYYIGIVKPNIAVSTAEAFRFVKPAKPKICLKSAILEPISNWKETIYNDFEDSIFKQYPQIEIIKHKLYEMNAIYAQMSGSGSALFGIFEKNPETLHSAFQDCFTYITKL